MIKNLTCQFLFLVLSCAVVFTSCDDEAPYYGQGIPSDYNLLYSNRSSTQPDAGELTISFSGLPVYGKDVYFEMSTETTARLKFYYVFPTEKEVWLEGVKLISTSNGFSFSENGVTDKGTSYTVSGTIEKGKLAVSLTDVKIPSHPLIGTKLFLGLQGTRTVRDTENTRVSYIYTRESIVFNWKSTVHTSEESTLGFLADLVVPSLLQNLLYLVLHDVVFLPDGNVVANYSGFPEDFDFLSLLGSVSESDRAASQQSPLNLCYYFVEGNTLLIQPDAEMIMRAIFSATSRSEDSESSVGGLGEMLNLLIEVFPEVWKWMQEGIKLNIEQVDRVNPYNSLVTSLASLYYYHDNDFRIWIDKETAEPIIAVLPLLIDLLLGDVDIPAEFSSIIDLDAIKARIPYTTTFDLGFYLNKQ